MKAPFLLWSGAVVVLIFALARPDVFLSSFALGLGVGAVLVVLVLLPWFLRSHERRLSALERGHPSDSTRDSQVSRAVRRRC